MLRRSPVDRTRRHGRRCRAARTDRYRPWRTVGVTFRALTDAEIDAYIATGEPMDKAGAYGIQGFGAVIVERVDGDYFAVMGLALGRLVKLLREVGVAYEFGRLRDLTA